MTFEWNMQYDIGSGFSTTTTFGWKLLNQSSYVEIMNLQSSGTHNLIVSNPNPKNFSRFHVGHTINHRIN